MIHWTSKPFNELSAHELYAILQLRNEVFIVEQNCHYHDCDNKDLKAWHLMGMENGKLAAYARLLPPGLSYAQASIGRVATSKEARRKGYGRELMKEAIRRTAELFDTRQIRIGAQLYLEHFYESLGFTRTGDIYLEDNIPHIEMEIMPF